MTGPNCNQGESLDVDAAQARCDAATPGPWEAFNQAGRYGVESLNEGVADDVVFDGKTPLFRADAEFIAAARRDLPAALAEVRVLRARVAELEATLASEREAHLDAIRNDGRVTYDDAALAGES